jgi:type IV secretory pathway VirB9-like protein
LRWKKAQAIRAYIRHIQEFPVQYAESENLNEWMSWAIEKAEWYDPVFLKVIHF